MSLDKTIASLHLHDLTRAQLLKLFTSAQHMSMLRDKRSDEEKDEEDDAVTNDNDDLVDLHKEKKGDSRPPKVQADDLPKGVTLPEEDDEEEEKIASKKKGKK